ncbi:MAG: serine protease [Methanomassiliicoccaceae archaeon]|nr:serine protease [Methanomassiliicoccaceae archaeon]
MIVILSVFIFFFHTDENSSFDLEEYMGGIVEIECGDGDRATVYGSGFIIDHDGIKVLSNAHVVMSTEGGTTKAYENIWARFFDSEQRHNLYVISYDTRKDIAVLGFYETDILCDKLVIDTNRTKFGEEIFAVGNARGYGLSVKDGIVSIPEIIIIRNGVERVCVVVSSPINEGDSGGPILNKDGKVIGMMSFRLRDDDNNIVQGMSYAIPSSEIDSYLLTVPSLNERVEIDQ